MRKVLALTIAVIFFRWLFPQIVSVFEEAVISSLTLWTNLVHPVRKFI